MPDTFEIGAASGKYAVTVGRGLIADVVAGYTNAIVIIDAKLVNTLPASVRNWIAIAADEKNKSLEHMPVVIAALREYKAGRDTHVIAIGGGVIQDIVTFASSIYMRGLAWTYMPTTLLSMADSCIGGKSSINVQNYKNLVGNFYPPGDVVIDPDYVTTLDREMVVGGLFEAVKICYARGAEQFEHYLALEASFPLTPERAAAVVCYALLTKKWFIEIDEFDRKERLLLNFGHTFGHAVEGATDFAVSHGIAVGIGMLAAIGFARDAGALSPEGAASVARLEQYVLAALSPAKAPVIAVPPMIILNIVVEKFEYDKKHGQDGYRVVLPQQDGALQLITLPRDASSRAAVRRAFVDVFSALGWSCE